MTTTTTTRRRKTTTRTTIRTSGKRRGERGVALILVLWTFAAVAVLAAEFARAMHDEAASTRNFKESTRARMVAIAGVNEVILALQANRRDKGERIEHVEDELDPDPIRSLAHGDGQWVQATFRGSRYEVRVIDEGGKIGLNQVDGNQLRTILDNLDVDEDDAETIADSIVDWRDEDDFHQPNGAESEYYEGLDRPYRAKNAAFDAVEELLLVRGVTREVFYGDDEIPGLRYIFSVFNETKVVNPKSATPAVMQALGGLDAQAANDYASARRRTGGDVAVDELSAALSASGIRTPSRDTPVKMTVEARVHDPTGQAVLAHIGAVLNLSSNGDGLRLYRWYDSIFDDSDSSGGTSAAADSAS